MDSQQIVSQCGRPAHLCDSCDEKLHAQMSMPACKNGWLPCKFEDKPSILSCNPRKE